MRVSLFLNPRSVRPEDDVPVFDGPEDFIERSVIVGSVDTVIEKIRAANAALGIDHIRAEFKFGDLPLESVRESFGLFAAEVVPRLNPEQMPGPRTTSIGAKLGRDGALSAATEVSTW